MLKHFFTSHIPLQIESSRKCTVNIVIQIRTISSFSVHIILVLVVTRCIFTLAVRLFLQCIFIICLMCITLYVFILTITIINLGALSTLSLFCLLLFLYNVITKKVMNLLLLRSINDGITTNCTHLCFLS